MTLHPRLAQLLTEWTRAEVVWAVLRTPEDPARPDGDVDILLEQRTAFAAERIAWECGFVTVPGRPYDVHLVAYDRECGRWLWLHCVTELAFGPYRAVRPGLENRWLAQRVTAGPLVVLAPGDEFWITLMHALLDKGALSERSRRRLGAAVEGAVAEGPLPEALQPVLPAGWSPRSLLERVRAREWDALERLAPAIRQAAVRRGRPLLPVRLWRRAARVWSDIGEARRRRGVSVALLGPDGAGKSTLAAELRRSYVLPVREVYMGLTGGWLKYIDKLRLPVVVQVARFLVFWGRYLRGQYHTYLGRLVVFDRYIYDAEVPTPRPLSHWARAARWLDGRSCPGPDLVLILDAPGSVMHERKGQYTAEMLEDWRQHFLRLRDRLPNVEVVDTTCPPDAVRATAMEHIWRCYARQRARR